MSSMGIETDHVAEHPGRLVERAVAVIVTVTVLLQEVVLDNLSDFQGNLVGFVKTRLHNPW